MNRENPPQKMGTTEDVNNLVIQEENTTPVSLLGKGDYLETHNHFRCFNRPRLKRNILYNSFSRREFRL